MVAPRLGERKPVPGPPKRFAQGMGAAILDRRARRRRWSSAITPPPMSCWSLLAVAAGLESIFALCLGCQMFALLMRAGRDPEEVCAECADIRLRLRAAGQPQAYSPSRSDARPSAAPRRMSCSETSTSSSPNSASTSTRIRIPATIVGARSG